jgi:hypothetical protein
MITARPAGRNQSRFFAPLRFAQNDSNLGNVIPSEARDLLFFAAREDNRDYWYRVLPVSNDQSTSCRITG